jgi:hypothetical protein
MSTVYRQRKKRRDRVLQRCAQMRAAKERRRIERAAGEPEWTRVATALLVVFAAPDGRSIEMRLATGNGEVVRCGSLRAVRGAISRAVWGHRHGGETDMMTGLTGADGMDLRRQG